MMTEPHISHLTLGSRGRCVSKSLDFYVAILDPLSPSSLAHDSFSIDDLSAKEAVMGGNDTSGPNLIGKPRDGKGKKSAGERSACSVDVRGNQQP